MKNFKKGAASFYIVAFSTLVLLILAVSFATVIIAELERTSNDDLSQSAYDSAMAGVEEAKLAFYNYQTCKNKNDNSALCKQVVYLMENPANYNCYMVGRMLGRIAADEESEVVIEDSNVGTSNNMQQSYTCVKIQTVLQDYRSTLSASNPLKVVKVNLQEGVSASAVKRVKISWYSDRDGRNYGNFDNKKIVFPGLGSRATAVPPTISVALVQTGMSFTLDDFSKTNGTQTDRGMVYLVPVNDPSLARGMDSSLSSNASDYGKYNATGANNTISKAAMVKSNNGMSKNLPYAVYCSEDDEFACSAIIELPEVIGGGARNEDTFMFAIGLPYGRPTTDFAIEFLCDGVCGTERVVGMDGTVTEVASNKAGLDGVQIKIDSTGRANDLYRRVEVRMESAVDSNYISLLGPLELVNSGTNGAGSSSTGLQKNYSVIVESGL